MEEWNVLATAHEGRRDALLTALRRLARFRPGGYRNVLICTVDDPHQFLRQVADALRRDTLLATALARVIPIDVTLHFDPNDAASTIAAGAEPLVDRLAGGTFFVRVERRGLKGKLHSQTLERALGDLVWRALEARGHQPRVSFHDPDAVLVVETLGDRVGLAVLPRALRAEFPFVLVR